MIYNKCMKALIVKKKLLKEILESKTYILAQTIPIDFSGDVLLVSMEENCVYALADLKQINILTFEEYMTIKKVDSEYYPLYQKQDQYYGYQLENIRLFTEKFKINRDNNKDFLYCDVDDQLLKGKYLEVTLL